jgi:hypothetical protein
MVIDWDFTRENDDLIWLVVLTILKNMNVNGIGLFIILRTWILMKLWTMFVGKCSLLYTTYPCVNWQKMWKTMGKTHGKMIYFYQNGEFSSPKPDGWSSCPHIEHYILLWTGEPFSPTHPTALGLLDREKNER